MTHHKNNNNNNNQYYLSKTMMNYIKSIEETNTKIIGLLTNKDDKNKIKSQKLKSSYDNINRKLSILPIQNYRIKFDEAQMNR